MTYPDNLVGHIQDFALRVANEFRNRAPFYAEYQFAIPSKLWRIEHGQDSFAVTVQTFDINGLPYEGEVTYVTSSIVEVSWFYPTAGTARVYT